jgi:hypothetical protein
MKSVDKYIRDSEGSEVDLTPMLNCTGKFFFIGG